MLPPGSRIGLLGGGQLGRMLALAAARLGFDAVIYADSNDSPAARVAARSFVGDFEDERLLRDFAATVDVVTVEFENVPARTAAILREAGATVRPGAEALGVAQDRVREKTFLNGVGVATTRFAVIDSEKDLERAIDELGAPAFLKTRRFGYDGKGQARVSGKEGAGAAYRMIGEAPAILEAGVDFEMEISVVAARGADGAFAAFDPSENTHRDGILRVSRAPARLAGAVAEEAVRSAHAIADALDYVGVLCVEFFLTRDGRLLANEIAPRVHNSGHWTEVACLTSQFEQQIRAVAGWPLGPVDLLAPAEMANLIGDEVSAWQALAADPTARVHLYGKREARDGRKMGHVTRLIRD